MSLDALGPSPRRMARAPPPPVAPKRFHLKDPPQDLLHKDLRRVASPDGRKQSAVERLAADRAKYVKGGQPALSAKPQQPTRASPHPPVIRKQLVPHSCAIGSGHTKASPQRPQRKVAPTAGTQTGVPVLDLKHLTNLISGVGETTSTYSPFSTPSTSLHATSSSSQSSEGMGTGEEGGEGMTKEGRGDENIEPSAILASSSSPPTENLASTSSSSPTSPPAQLLPTSPCQSLSGMLKPDHSGPLGPPAMTVRRVDVMPQVASVRKPMQAVPQTRMQGPTQRPQTRPQSQAHLMHLLKAQLAARNAPLLPKNAPLLAGAQLNVSSAGVGVKVGPTGITPRGLPGNAAPQPHLPLHQNGNGAPPTVSPTMASPKQPLEGPAHPLPQGPLTTDPGQLPVSCQQPTGRLGNPGSRITLLPSPLVLGDTGGRGSPSATAASSSPALVPSPCPSLLTRVSSTSSRKRPSLSRSKSDLSDRFSRAGADLERFFNYCGLDPTDLRQLAQPGSDIASVSVSMSRLRSASAPASECSQENADEMEEEEEEDPRRLQRTPYGISVIERNARVIKWLYGMRQARDPARVANI